MHSSFRPISTDTKQTFCSYVDLGHSPSSAIHHHINLEHEGREKEFEICTCRPFHKPTPKDIYYLYNKWRVDKHGPEKDENVFEQLEKLVRTYNDQYGEAGGRAFIQRYEKQSENATWEKKTSDHPLVLAICTP